MNVEVRYYIDQSLMGVWHEWGSDRDDVTVVGELAGTAPGDKDEDWIPVVAAAGLVVIGRDKRIRTRPAEFALLRSHGLRYIWLGGKQDERTPTTPCTSSTGTRTATWCGSGRADDRAGACPGQRSALPTSPEVGRVHEPVHDERHDGAEQVLHDPRRALAQHAEQEAHVVE